VEIPVILHGRRTGLEARLRTEQGSESAFVLDLVQPQENREAGEAAGRKLSDYLQEVGQGEYLVCVERPLWPLFEEEFGRACGAGMSAKFVPFEMDGLPKSGIMFEACDLAVVSRDSFGRMGGGLPEWRRMGGHVLGWNVGDRIDLPHMGPARRHFDAAVRPDVYDVFGGVPVWPAGLSGDVQWLILLCVAPLLAACAVVAFVGVVRRRRVLALGTVVAGLLASAGIGAFGWARLPKVSVETVRIVDIPGGGLPGAERCWLRCTGRGGVTSVRQTVAGDWPRVLFYDNQDADAKNVEVLGGRRGDGERGEAQVSCDWRLPKCIETITPRSEKSGGGQESGARSEGIGGMVAQEFVGPDGARSARLSNQLSKRLVRCFVTDGISAYDAGTLEAGTMRVVPLGEPSAALSDWLVAMSKDGRQADRVRRKLVELMTKDMDGRGLRLFGWDLEGSGEGGAFEGRVDYGTLWTVEVEP
jgi:hypothetical protein